MMNVETIIPKNDKNCIVFGITSNLSFALGSFLMSFLAHHQEWDGHVHVFHDGISENDVKKIMEIFPKTNFQFMDKDHVLNRLNQAKIKNESIQQTIQRYSAMYFAKFEMFDLLKHYDKCIWFDVDMIVNSSFDEIWNFQDIAWRPVLQKTDFKNNDLKKYYADILGSHKIPRPNAGLICASSRIFHEEKIDAQYLYDTFLEIIFRKEIVTGDEMSLLIMASKNKLSYKRLTKIYNCPSGSIQSDRAKIIHSIGPRKFWNDGAVSAAYPNWRKHYQEWISIGGSPYLGHVNESYIPIKPHAIISKARKISKEHEIFDKFLISISKINSKEISYNKIFLQIPFYGDLSKYYIAINSLSKDINLSNDKLFHAFLEGVIDKDKDLDEIQRHLNSIIDSDGQSDINIVRLASGNVHIATSVMDWDHPNDCIIRLRNIALNLNNYLGCIDKEDSQIA
jgi:lipopolysaccharide biosynthesis glycosyltransferase